MAPDNIKDFTIQWIQFGLLIFALLSFAIVFMYNNNPTALGDSGDVLEGSRSSMQGRLVTIPNESNVLLNITSQTNPEASELGSRDSVATSYGITGSGKGFFEEAKLFMAWVITGTSGKILISVFTGMFGFLAFYFIYKSIRQGS